MSAAGAKRVIIFVDFDGTAAQEIASERLLGRFAQGDWREWDRQLEAGKISFRDCVIQQYSMLVGTREEMIEFCGRELELRAGFVEFVQYCRSRDYRVVIVSEALDFMIHAILERAELSSLSVYSDRAVFQNGRIAVELPFARADCPCNVGNCKQAHVRAQRDQFDLVVYIGDGSNDLCPAREADIIFARRRLAEQCRAQHLEYTPFEDFYEINHALTQLGL